MVLAVTVVTQVWVVLVVMVGRGGVGCGRQ